MSVLGLYITIISCDSSRLGPKLVDMNITSERIIAKDDIAFKNSFACEIDGILRHLGLIRIMNP